jgi:hypothetical protein
MNNPCREVLGNLSMFIAEISNAESKEEKPSGVLPCFDPKGFSLFTPHTQQNYSTLPLEVERARVTVLELTDMG